MKTIFDLVEAFAGACRDPESDEVDERRELYSAIMDLIRGVDGARRSERDWELMAKSEFGVDGVSDFIDAIRAERRSHWQKLSHLGSLLKSVTISEMGGTPDLFGPRCGWDEWDEEVTDSLAKALPCYHLGRVDDGVCPRCYEAGTEAVAWQGRT